MQTMPEKSLSRSRSRSPIHIKNAVLIKEIKIHNKDLKYHTHSKPFYTKEKKAQSQMASFLISAEHVKPKYTQKEIKIVGENISQIIKNKFNQQSNNSDLQLKSQSENIEPNSKLK